MANPKSDGILISYRADRFGARLTSLVNTRRLSLTCDIPFSVYWVQASDIGAVFNDATELFDADFVAEHFMSEEDWRNRRQKARRIADVPGHSTEGLGKLIAKGKDVLVDMAFGITVLNDEDPEQVRQDYVDAFHGIPKSPQLAEIFDKIAPLLKDATAYHIRRGDLVDVLKAKNRSWPGKFIPSEFYAYHMRMTMDGDAKIVLFSDERDTISHYKDEFPEALSLRDLIGDTDLSEGAYDFLELYAMSCCKKIIAPKQSAFSAAASELGNATIVPLMEDLDAAHYAEAFALLIEALEGPPAPDFNQGEIGQSLVHATNHLIAGGEERRAGQLLDTWVTRGLNISHIYATAVEMQTRLEDYDSVLRIGAKADQGYVLFSKDRVVVDCAQSYAHLMTGNTKQACRLAQSAFWLDPMHSENQAVIAGLIMADVLNDSNFFPIERGLLDADRRGGPGRQLAQTYPGILARLPNGPERHIPSLISMAWDWSFFLRNQRGPNKGDGERISVRIENLRERFGNEPWMDGFDATLEAKFGDIDAGIALFETQFSDTGSALTAYRCSAANWDRRDIPAVMEWAKRAVEASDAPIYKVWYANMLTRHKRFEEAEMMLAASVGPLSGLASVLEIEANLWSRTKATDKLVNTYAEIAKLAPMSGYMRQQQAAALVTAGREAEALNVIKEVCDTENATPKGYGMYIEFLASTGDTAGHAEVLEYARQRFPTSNHFS